MPYEQIKLADRIPGREPRTGKCARARARNLAWWLELESYHGLWEARKRTSRILNEVYREMVRQNQGVA